MWVEAWWTKNTANYICLFVQYTDSLRPTKSVKRFTKSRAAFSFFLSTWPSKLAFKNNWIKVCVLALGVRKKRVWRKQLTASTKSLYRSNWANYRSPFCSASTSLSLIDINMDPLAYFHRFRLRSFFRYATGRYSLNTDRRPTSNCAMYRTVIFFIRN